MLVLVLGIVVLAPPDSARADGCDHYDWASTDLDYASISDSNNDCWQIFVRHRYDPVWSWNNYWEGWESTWGTYVPTDYAAELLYGQYDATFPLD